MKVLMVAVFNDRSTNNSQADGFEKCGCEVIRYNYRERASHLGPLGRDEEIISLCSAERPDIIFFSKCNGVHHKVIDHCNRFGSTVLWYMDPMSNFDYELVQKVIRAKFVFCGLQDPLHVAKRLNQNSFFLHEGYDHLCNYPVQAEYKHDVSFIGMLRGDRHRYFQEIGFDLITNAYGVDHSIAVAQSKINLNFTEGGTSDRTYKVLASRGFLLTQPWPGMEDDFVPGLDFDTFETVDELNILIAYYLDRPELRGEMAQHGFNTVQKFSRINFAKQILDTVMGD